MDELARMLAGRGGAPQGGGGRGMPPPSGGPPPATLPPEAINEVMNAILSDDGFLQALAGRLAEMTAGAPEPDADNMGAPMGGQPLM